MIGDVPDNTLPTIGIEFKTKIVTLEDRVKIKVQVWDTGNLFIV